MFVLGPKEIFYEDFDWFKLSQHVKLKNSISSKYLF